MLNSARTNYSQLNNSGIPHGVFTVFDNYFWKRTYIILAGNPVIFAKNCCPNINCSGSHASSKSSLFSAFLVFQNCEASRKNKRYLYDNYTVLKYVSVNKVRQLLATSEFPSLVVHLLV